MTDSVWRLNDTDHPNLVNIRAADGHSVAKGVERADAERIIAALNASHSAAGEMAALREALPDPSKLWALAEWIDQRYPNDSNPEVQRDLRAWARRIMATGQYQGVTAKNVLEPLAAASPTAPDGESDHAS